MHLIQTAPTQWTQSDGFAVGADIEVLYAGKAARHGFGEGVRGRKRRWLKYKSQTIFSSAGRPTNKQNRLPRAYRLSCRLAYLPADHLESEPVVQRVGVYFDVIAVQDFAVQDLDG